jgi:hypothetical protein
LIANKIISEKDEKLKKHAKNIFFNEIVSKVIDGKVRKINQAQEDFFANFYKKCIPEFK